MNGYGIGGGVLQGYDAEKTMAVEQSPQGALSRAIEMNQKLLHLLHEQISTVEARASAFMRPDGPRPGADTANPPRVSGSPLSEAVLGINGQLETAVERLRVIASRFDN